MATCCAAPQRRPQWFVAAWLAVLLVHWVCVAYYVGVAVAYLYLPTSNLAFRLRTYSIGIAESEFGKIATVHAAVAVVHVASIVIMLVGSLQRRRLAFYPHRPRIPLLRCTRRVAAEGSSQSTPRKPSLARIARLFSQTRDRVGTAIFSRQGLLGVDFAYFDHLLLARELVETGLQTYQAYRMSHLLSRPWLVRAYVSLLILNCWAMPVLHRAYAKRDTTRRLVSVVCDVVLDLVSSIGISCFIFRTYVPQYTDPRFGFPSVNWFNDKWFVTVLQEFQMMLVVSWTDMATRLCFACGLVQSVECLKEMVDPTLCQDADGEPQHVSSISTACSVVPSGPAAVGLEPEASTLRRSRKVHDFVLHAFGPALFLLWGLAILAIHIHAEATHTTRPCQLPLRPWLNTKPACSLVVIDCYNLNSSATAGSLEDAWSAFDPTLAAGLVVRHCPHLTMPSTLNFFTEMTSMKVYNATIVSWQEEAGLTVAAHARLRVLYLVRTNFTDGALPRGLQRSDFPKTMSSFFVSVTNLARLPEDLDKVWPKRMTISIEHARLTSVPGVVLRLSPGLLSLMRNPIRILPAQLFEIPTLRNLFVSYTAIQELPRDVTRLSPSLYALFVEGTNVSTFWSWVNPIITRSLAYQKGLFNAHATPYCRELEGVLNGTRSHFTGGSGTNDTAKLATIMDVSTPARIAYAVASVGCTAEFKTLFPLAAQDASSAIR